MIIRTKQKNERGYILLYVVLAITLFVALASSVVKSTVTDIELGVQELNAVRAQAAADAAIECFSFWARQPEFPFNPNTPSLPLNCSTGGGVVTFNSPARTGNWCTTATPPHNYTAVNNLPALNNGACADVQVEVIPRYVTGVYPAPNTPLCSLRIRATGYDDCGLKTTSRVRWETIGGWSSPTNPTNTTPVNGYNPPISAPHSADGFSLVASSAPYAVLQVEVSGVAGSVHESNAIDIWALKTNAGYFPIGDVILYRVVGIPPALSGLTWGFEPTTMPIGEAARLHVSVPGNATQGFYRMAVRVSYGRDVYDDVMVYLDIRRSGRGQE